MRDWGAMPHPLAKICGLSTPDTLDAAVTGGAAYVGFVFFPPSPRHLDLARAAALAARVPDHVGKVGVFVDPDDSLIDAACAAAGLTHVQLHHAAPARVAELAGRGMVEVWAVVSVKRASDLEAAGPLAAAGAARILYDARTPDGALLPGGMGLRFDWAMLNGVRHPAPWGLAGGLNPDNVAEAVQRTGAPMVDVSSGVESAPGVKDTGRISAFLRAIAAT